jgi:multiple antibiotic resistance protein
MLKLSSIFILFFITLGPIKTIAPFVQLTAGADGAICRRVALRATLASTAVVLILCFVGPLILENWGVSFPAVTLTGGIILFLLSLQVMLKPTESLSKSDAVPATLSASMLISRLVIPTIVTPPGIAAILALMVLSEGNPQLWLQIMGLLLLVMLVNLLAMLAARQLLAFLTVAGLRAIGWVFAVLQASLGAQVIINSLRKLGALPIQSL